MHYFQHNFGDFNLDLKYLNFEQRGIYWDFVERYLTTGNPLDTQWLASIRRLASEGAVDTVLALCFEEKDGKFHHKKLDEILSDYEKMAEKNRQNAQKRSKNKQKDTIGNPLDTDSQPSGNPLDTLTTNNKPINNKQIKEKNIKKKSTLEKPEAVTQQTWDDFVSLRKEKKATLTTTALKGIEREAEKAGITLESALKTCCMRGWRGFKAEWVTDKVQQIDVGLTSDQITDEQADYFASELVKDELFNANFGWRYPNIETMMFEVAKNLRTPKMLKECKPYLLRLGLIKDENNEQTDVRPW